MSGHSHGGGAGSGGHSHGAAGHSHGGAGHTHGAGQHGPRLAIAFAITATIVVVQGAGALWTGSLALLVDTAHMLTDAGGLAMALVASRLMARPPSGRRTWGFRRAEVLAAALQAALLLVVGAYVLVEGVQRLFDPPAAISEQLLLFGVVGLVGNAASIAVLASARSADLNLRAAFLEVVNDALGSVAVIVAGVVVITTGWTRADALAAILIGVLILPRTLKLLLETVDVLLESAPRGLDLESVRAHLLALEHVRGVHDLHASQIATGLPVLTAHVVVDDACFHDGHTPRMLDLLQGCVAEHFEVSVEHSTFQLEPASHAAHESAHHH